MTVTEADLVHLRRCLALAAEALEDDDEPFGSVLVDGTDVLLFEDRNRVNGGDATQHPEFAIARWAAEHLSPVQRRDCTVYTSGEHCPMCAAAHAWVGLGRIIYIASSAQLSGWMTGWGAPPAPVTPLPIETVAPDVVVQGPVESLVDEIKALHRRHFESTQR